VTRFCQQVYDNITSEPVHIPKSYGKSIKSSDLPNGIAMFFPVSSIPADVPAASTLATSTHDMGLPRHILLPILHAIREDISELRDALSEIHMRMVGGSILIVYEADWARAEEGVKAFEFEKQRAEADEGDEPDDEDVDDDDGDDDDDNDDDDDDDDETKRQTIPYAVKLIDFAHTQIKPGQGSDTGVLLGLDTVLKLLDGRIEQVRCTAG
jgi:1D-myo-inositol-tetrakisphosphate 5-kinase/inositol-polyphosphate multikinase